MIVLYLYNAALSMNDGDFETLSNFFKMERVVMITYERQKIIMDYLAEKKISTVKELSKVVWASESSIRRDLRSLAENGCVTLLYGGVMTADYANNVVPIKLRDSQNSSVKDSIAERAAEYIFSGATIFLDGSSTVKRIVKHTAKFSDLKIITYNQQIFSEYNNAGNNNELYCTGGLFNSESNIFSGSAVRDYIENTAADICFFSSQAISGSGDISDVSDEETSIRKLMLAHSKKKIFLCDSSKIGLQKTFKLCTKDDVDLIICNEKLPWER